MPPAPLPPDEIRNGASPPPVDAALLDNLARSKAVNGENLLDRMVTLFTESGVQLLDQMDEALRQDDVTGAVRAVHKLAGGCSYFGAEKLYSLCTELERAGSNGDQAPVRALGPRIREEYARVAGALKWEGAKRGLGL